MWRDKIDEQCIVYHRYRDISDHICFNGNDGNLELLQTVPSIIIYII